MRTSRPWRYVALLSSTLLALVGGGVVLVSEASATSYAAMQTTVLRGDVIPHLKTARNLGVTNPSTHVLVGIAIARPHAAEENAMQRAMYTKGNPLYHHFLTPSAFAQRFGVSSSTYDAVKGWTTRNGMAVAHTTQTGTYLTVSGTARQAENTFAVRLNDYRQGGKSFFANANAPTIPAGLGVTGILGLNSKLKSTLPATTPAKTKHALARGYVTTASRATAKPAATGTAAVTPDQDNCTGPACIGLTTPQDLWSTYDQPTNNYGQGQSMAIFGEGQYAPVVTNLREFENVHGLPQIPLKVVLTDGGAADYSDDAGEVEWDLDTQSSTGMAPQALNETLYFASSLSDASVLDDFEAWAEDPNGPLQASASFGECEENPVGDTTNSAYAFSAGAQFTLDSEATFQQAVMEGRTVFASTGDTGSSCPVVPVDVNGVGNEGYPVVNYPASSPNVVAVGGTVLYTDGTGAAQTGLTPSGAARVAEYSWTFTGGGSSVTFPQPSYQTKYAAPTPSSYCVDAPGGATVTPATVPCRGIPDIAAQSGDVASNGYGIVADGETTYPGGGTSLSSPLSLGMWTRINAAAPAVVANGATTYPGLGFANETYYKDYKTNPGDFFDVGGGASSPPTSNGAYDSAPGDDYLSGLGVPDITKIANHVDGHTAPTNPILPTYPTASPTTNPCSPTLFTDVAGDDAYIGDPAGSGSNPQLDLLSGAMTVVGSNLVTTLTIKSLTKAPATAAGAANDYYMLWTYNGTQYFSTAEVDTTTGDVTYGDGTVSGTTFTNANTDTGAFNMGNNGTVVVTVPLANIGSPASGALLQAPAGQTRVLVGTTATGGFIEQADSGGPQYDFQIGAACDPSHPVPTTAGVPVVTTSPTPIRTATATPNPTFTPTASPSFSLEPTPSATSSPTATPTATPTRTKSPGPDNTRPVVHKLHRHSPRFNHRRIRVILTDNGSGIAKITKVHLHGCTWNVGKARPVRYTKARHQVTIVITLRPHHRSGLAKFEVFDKAGNMHHVHARFRKLPHH